ncbi:tetratricopeptide repeat domain 7 [Dermatophagoides farinae]|uniref:tetratricopeptide repeat domain 7 n=1 Tax=Dermatophagoides farinae TaxID=6954 RepID=UPI001F0E74FA|nr:LOW QUALITY PROTEIN: tetratricopeptide repeat protein 7B-like [Dermatophagoides farinae]
MSSPRARPKSDMDIEKHREEGNWQQCLKLAQQSTEHKELQNFLTGEAKLEIFLEEIAKKNGDSKSKQNDEIDSTVLDEAKSFLKKCIEGNDETPLMMDANLLLAKAYYISGDYHDALNYIRQSGIDSILDVDRNLPLRVIKLIAESFTVKGMSLEKISNLKPLKYIDQVYDLADSYAKSADKEWNMNGGGSKFRKQTTFEDKESYRTQIDCLQKASMLAMRYVHGITQLRGPYLIVNLGCILESALLKTHHVFIKNDHSQGAIDYCRRMLNVCETNSTLNIRQLLSKELAEILIKGMCRSVWKKPEHHLKQQSNPPIYFGNSLFLPQEFEEEVMLLLMLSEALASLNVLLERSPDFHESRVQSLNKVLLIQDLFTMFLVPLQCYYVDTYERAMKYSYEVKHVWYQFALTLMESKKSPLRSYLLFKEVIRMDPQDPIPCLFAAKLCLTELNRFEDANEILQDALNRHEKLIENRKKQSITSSIDAYAGQQSYESSALINHINEIYGEQNLLHHIYLLLGITNALLYESDTETSKKFRKKYLADSVGHLNESIEQDIYGNDHLPYFHLALHLAHQRVLKEAIKYVRVSLLLNGHHLPSIQLLILCLTGLKQYDEAYELCQNALKEYESHLILLYIKANLERIVCENGHELALLTAKEMLKQWRLVAGEENRRLSPRASYCSFIPTINYDTMSLRMEQTLSEVISLESAPVGSGSNSAGQQLHQPQDLSFGQSDRLYLSQASSVNGSNLVLNENRPCSQAFEMQIWLLIVELFLQLDQINEAETCVNDGAVAVFGQLSHQLMYIKGVISKKRGHYYDAKIHFHNAISINPKHAQALQQLGHTYHMLGNQIIAEKYLKDSLNIDSTRHETWCYLGLVLDAMNEDERATECHLTSIRLEESSPLLPFSIIPRCVLE